MKNNSVDIQSHSKHTEISSPRKTKTDSDTNNVKMQMFIIFAKIQNESLIYWNSDENLL